MENSGANKEFVLDYEKQFAANLAVEILEKPKVKIWMILIPLLLIVHFTNLSKNKRQRKEFIDNYLISRRKALNEAEEAMDENRKPDTDNLALQAGLKEKHTRDYSRFLSVLVEHYTKLLNGAGETYGDLIKSVYGNNRSDYLLFLDLLEKNESTLNKSLKSQLRKKQDGIGETIRQIEKKSYKLRRLELEEIYG